MMKPIRRKGRPRKAPDAPPIPDHTLCGVLLPHYAYTRTLEDNARTIRVIMPITEPLQVPIKWYRTNGITMQWVRYLLTQRDEPRVVEEIIADATNGARYLVEQLRLDYEARQAAQRALATGQPLPIPDATQPFLAPLDEQARRAVTNALLQTIRKLWVAYGILLAKQKDHAAQTKE
jgi:hypothetical protein